MPGFRRSTYGPYPGYDVGDLARRRYVDVITRKAGLWPGDLALDAECGHGTVAVPLARAFTKARVVAADRSRKMLERTLANAKVEGSAKRVDLVQADPAFLPFREEAFVVVVFALALRDLEDAEEALAEAHRATAFAGKLFVVEADFTRTRMPPPGEPASVLDAALHEALKEMGWGKLSLQRVDVLGDGTLVQLLHAKRFDVPETAEGAEDAEAEEEEERGEDEEWDEDDEDWEEEGEEEDEDA